MTTVLASRLPRLAALPLGGAGLAAAAGLALLYLPSYVGFATGIWREDAYAHGPLVLAVAIWLAWRERAALSAGEPARLAGGLALAVGLALWLLGRTQSLPLFEAASHVPVAAGLVLLAGGWAALRRLAFPVLFLVFLVPWPGFVLEAATGPLKQFVSVAVAQLLALLGYAVERNGVVLALGGQEMLVADACSGLNSIVSLLALGLLYLHLTGPRSRARCLAVLASIVPLAIVGNVLRVLILVLVTHHAGAPAAEGWLHAALGLLVFAIALGGMLWIGDGAKRDGAKRDGANGDGAVGDGAEVLRPQPLRPQRGALAVLVAAGAMATVAAAAPGLRPMPDPLARPDIAALLPQELPGWRLDPEDLAVPPAPEGQAKQARLYSQVVSRTYVNEAGERMLLTVAYGGDQSDALKAHRQEVCYQAQGFEVHGVQPGRVEAAGRNVPVTRFHAIRGDRSEPVTYWLTMGDRVVRGRGERLVEQLRHGIRGRVPDGLMVRISSLATDPRAAYAAHATFAAALLAPLAPTDATRLAGAPGAIALATTAEATR